MRWQKLKILLEMVTPIRGRKPFKKTCEPVFALFIRNGNPDKGTETYKAIKLHTLTVIRLEMVTPIRGRKLIVFK